jgi:hypothetical protein
MKEMPESSISRPLAGSKNGNGFVLLVLAHVSSRGNASVL